MGKAHRHVRDHRRGQRRQIRPRPRHVRFQGTAQAQCRIRVQHEQPVRRQQHRLQPGVGRQLGDDRLQPLHRHVHADHADRARLRAVAGQAQRQVVGGEIVAAGGGVAIRLGPPRRRRRQRAPVPGHGPVVVAQRIGRLLGHGAVGPPQVPGEAAVVALQRTRLDHQQRSGDVRIALQGGVQQAAQIERLAPDRRGAGGQRAPAHLHRAQRRIQAARGLLGQPGHLVARIAQHHLARAQIEQQRQAQQQRHLDQAAPQHQPRAQAVPPGHCGSVLH